MTVFTVTLRLLARLRELAVFHTFDGSDRWRVGDEIDFSPGARIEPFTTILAGNRFPHRMGAWSYSRSRLDRHVVMGRYCSIADQVTWMGPRHPVEWATTSPAAFDNAPPAGIAAFFGVTGTPYSPQSPPAADDAVRIGSDVWIGTDAMIGQGLSIGDGAVIGARSLVLHDVPPYAVVGGNPARVLRMRFPEGVVEQFLALQWWRYTPDLLQRAPVQDATRFLGEFREIIERERAQPVGFAPLLDHADVAATCAAT